MTLTTKRISAAIACALALAVLPGTAAAWNAGTHAYISAEVSAFEPDAAAELLTGGDPALTPTAARRLRAVLASVAERVHDAPYKVLTNLLTEHRRYALETLAHLRKRR
jgi:hypothetical protein